MCGIFGYLGSQDSLKICLSGLERLEYRGYDSTGIAGVREGELINYKKAGKLSNLKQELEKATLNQLDLIIGHTRWATHGMVNDKNAHPILDMKNEVAIVHNGIIENYHLLREKLIGEGISFSSETDTEVIVQLISKFYSGNLTEAVQKTIPLLKGIYAIAVIHKNHPDEIVAAAHECPLAIGIDEKTMESFLSSDLTAFGLPSLEVLFLHGGEVAKIKKGSIEVFNANQHPIIKKKERFDTEYSVPSKEGFDHYLLKEIREQPSTIAKAIEGRFNEKTGEVVLEELPFTKAELAKIEKICILGCGTSAHAGSIAVNYFEEMAKLPASCEIASEARYRAPLFTPNTLVIAISQSGETADTIAALREAKISGCKTLSICNVKHSTLSRETEGCLLLKAGPEISVCSTKALTSQIAVLALLAMYMAEARGFEPKAAHTFFSELKKVPAQIQSVIDSAEEIKKLASKYAHFNDFFFMGRLYMYTTSQEAALKLKEISYVHANGYAAGELKHGAIALINPLFPVVAFCANLKTKEKILSNLMEVKARGAPILAFAPVGMKEAIGLADDIFWLPPTIDALAPFTATVAGQLLAYYIAKIRGCDIDQPRNLAKSVTVE